jgi:hypothetical protein
VPDSVADPVADAAREWLTDLASMYAGIDTGPGDPVHDALVRAQEFLDAGPTRSDPFVIAGMMAEALPGDERAAGLADSWSQAYVRAVRSDRAVKQKRRFG